MQMCRKQVIFTRCGDSVRESTVKISVFAFFYNRAGPEKRLFGPTSTPFLSASPLFRPVSFQVEGRASLLK